MYNTKWLFRDAEFSYIEINYSLVLLPFHLHSSFFNL